MPKRIAIDLRPLQIGHENRGIGMVIKSVLNTLRDTKNTYVFYMFDSSNPLEDMNIDVLIDHYQIVRTPTLNTSIKSPSDAIDAFKLSMHSFPELRNLNVDVFIQFDPSLGIPRGNGIKTICVAYDLIPLIFRHEYLPTASDILRQSMSKKAKLKGLVRAFYYNARYRRFCEVYRDCTAIVSISEATKRSFLELLRVPESQVHTLPLAPVANYADAVELTASESTLGKPYLFYIGGTDSRKHVEDLIYTFNVIRSRGHDIALLLAGNELRTVKTIPSVKAREAIMTSPYRDDIHLRGFVTDQEKYSLYHGALAFLFTSAYEGFGLPLVEAAASRCPVVSYHNSAIPESIGDAALLVETRNYVAAAKAVISLFDEDLRAAMIEKGVVKTQEYSWAKFSAGLMRLVDQSTR